MKKEDKDLEVILTSIHDEILDQYQNNLRISKKLVSKNKFPFEGWDVCKDNLKKFLNDHCGSNKSFVTFD